MVALYRVGRQSEALEAFRTLRKRLDEELGIEPSTSIADLHRRILQHDRTLLDWSGDHPWPVAADRGSLTTAAIAQPPAATAVPNSPASPPPVTRTRPGRRGRRVLSSAVVALGLGVVVLGAGVATSGSAELTGNAVGVLDRAADAALALQATDPGRANRAWAEVQHRVVDGAPAVFGVTYRDLWYTSGRIGNYQQAEIYWPLFSQIWVR